MDAAEAAVKRDEYAALREKALRITDRAIKEKRQLSESESEQLGEYVEQAKAIQVELADAPYGASPELMKALSDLGKRPDAWGHLEQGAGMKVGYGETLAVKADGPAHPWAVAIEKASRARGEKAFAAPTGAIPLVPVASVPVSLGMLSAPLVQAIGLRAWPANGGRAVTYLRQVGRTNRAAIWRYGSAADGSNTSAKPTTDLTTVAVEANAEIIAHVATPVKRADLVDFNGMQQFVQDELVYGLLQALEAAVLTAAGTEPEMVGLLELDGTTAVTAASDIAGTIEKASVALSNLGYGDGLQAALSPSDWSTVATSKGSDGHYLFPGLPTSAAAPSIFGVQIIASPNVPSGTAVVANFRSRVALYEREAPVVAWGTIDDQFAKNLIAARCEGRFALTVPQPAAVAICDLTP